ncbi:MAG: PEP-CTERM sorting domain-containing protein [Myxococcota bacterium]
MFSARLPRELAISGVLAALAVFLTPTIAASTTYNFTSGQVQITAVIQGTATSVLEPGTSPVTVPLGGSFVDFDALAGPNGTITGLELVPTGSFLLDLDQTVAGFDVIEISNAMLVESPGATGAVSGLGSFAIDTILSGTVTGMGGPPPATPITSLQSGTSGIVGISGDTLTLGLFGINIATFQSLATPGVYVEVKADFTFVGHTVVPEPSTALLVGLGLSGLAFRGKGRPR